MINQKSIDFVLFDKVYFSPQIAIELDDSSHMLPEREERDNFVGSILNRVNIKMIHILINKNYKIENIIKKINC